MKAYRELQSGKPAAADAAAESGEEYDSALRAKARELLVLEFCHEVLSERIKSDSGQAHLWRVGDKVALGMLRYLRATLPAELRHPEPSLSAAERTQILEEHPLLHLSFVEPPDGIHVREHIRRIRAKLLKYLDLEDAEGDRGPKTED